jgi:protein-S-isoprenylcysteine O-methyltransferase Ste14
VPTLAIAGYVLFLLLGFGLRSWLHWRRTGTTGFVGLSGRTGSAEWTGGVLFIAALVAGAGAPVLQAMGVLAPAATLDTPALHALGVALYVLGATGTLWAQLAMGTAWRIGVDEDARTELVGAGPFRWVRNPIFSAMTVATAGLALMVPNPMSALAVVMLITGLEIHVRLVEEPYLARVHGERYRRYAAVTGRFVPGVGRRLGSIG